MKTCMTALALIIVSGCHSQQRPECADGALARIEAAYIADILQACDGQHFDTCDARPEIDAKYDALREEWVQCEN